MSRSLRITASAVLLAAATACGASSSRPEESAASRSAPDMVASPLATRNMPAVQGQQKTCEGPRRKVIDLDVVETAGIEIGMGMRFAAWTYNGRLPGPTIEACEGDVVAINVHNTGTTSHGLDTHAFAIDARRFGPTAPGTTLSLESVVRTPGVFMYHCAAGPVTDVHIKSGIHGAMIVYPRNERLPPAKEIVVVEDAVFGTADKTGLIPGTDPARTAKNDPLTSMFNGRLDNEPVQVKAGDLVRMYFVNVGPWTSAAHVIGTVFERVHAGEPWVTGVQTFPVAAGSGAMLEFRIPGPGVFPFVDHDKLAFLPFGLSLAFSTEPGAAAAH